MSNTATQVANTATKTVNTTTTVMITPVPAPKEVIVAPAGFISCLVIKAGWFNGQWIPDHRLCKYNPSSQGVAWIEGYWACIKFTTTAGNGACTGWDWKPGALG